MNRLMTFKMNKTRVSSGDEEERMMKEKRMKFPVISDLLRKDAEWPRSQVLQ